MASGSPTRQEAVRVAAAAGRDSAPTRRCRSAAGRRQARTAAPGRARQSTSATSTSGGPHGTVLPAAGQRLVARRALYALIAVGYTVVYGIIQLINFAHGEIFMIGAFGAFATWFVVPGSTRPLWAAAHDADRRHGGRRRGGSADRAVRVPPAAQRAAAGSADHRHRCLGVPAGGRPAVLRPTARLPGLQAGDPVPADRRRHRPGDPDRRGDHPAGRPVHPGDARDLHRVPLLLRQPAPVWVAPCRRPPRIPTPPG